MQLGHRVVHELAVVGDDRNGIRVAGRRRTIEMNHGHASRIGRADRRNHGLVVGMHDDDAVDAALNHGLHLLVLPVVVHVRDGFEHGPAAGLDVRGACARWPRPRTGR